MHEKLGLHAISTSATFFVVTCTVQHYGFYETNIWIYEVKWKVISICKSFLAVGAP